MANKVKKAKDSTVINMTMGQTPTEPGLYYRMPRGGSTNQPTLVSVEEIDGQLTCTSVDTFCSYPMGEDCASPEAVYWSARQSIEEIADVATKH